MSSSLEIHNQAYPIAVRDQGIIAKSGGNVVVETAAPTALAYALPLYVPISFTTQTGVATAGAITLPRIPRDGRTQVQYIYHRGVDTQTLTFTPQAAVVNPVPYHGDTINRGGIGDPYVYTVAAAAPNSVNVLITLISSHCPALGNINAAGWIISVAPVR
jgi:hypothetical protein